MSAYKITRGTTEKPIKACLYGVEGVGKTTFAAKWPGAVFIDVEDGSGHYDVARMPKPDSWSVLLDEIRAAAQLPDIGTLVIDTADAAEALCIAKVCSDRKWKGIEDAGYGKGYTYLAEEFQKLLTALDGVVASGKNVLVVAHAQIKRFAQPDEMGEYDRWELKLQKKCAPLVKEWCDLLLFANYKTDLMKDEQTKKYKATGGKRRVMYAAHTAAYDAKNRLGLPDEMPFDFEAIAEKIPGGGSPKPVKQEAAMPEDEAEAQAGAEAAASAAKPDRAGNGPTLAEMDSYLEQVASGDMNAKPPKFEEVTEPEFLQLHQLMADYQVNEAQLRDAVGSRKNNPYTELTPIGDYSIEFVRNTLLKHWEAIVATVRERAEIYKDIPFN